MKGKNVCRLKMKQSWKHGLALTTDYYTTFLSNFSRSWPTAETTNEFRNKSATTAEFRAAAIEIRIGKQSIGVQRGPLFQRPC